MPNVIANTLCLWRDSLLYLGDSFDPQSHRHHAVQCCIALEGKLRVHSGDARGWQSCRAAVIGADVAHRIANPDGPLCIVYLEKTSDSYRSIMDFHCLTPDCERRPQPLLVNQPIDSPLLTKLRSAMSIVIEPPAAGALMQECLRFFHGQLAQPKTLDSRISALLRYIHRYSGQELSGEKLAEVANLSASRMQHLFKAQLGIPIRRYVLWVRLRQVLEAALSGASLTAAAHQAGFADSAHFSRTFKAMFGIAPSQLLTAGTGLTAVFCERDD